MNNPKDNCPICNLGVLDTDNIDMEEKTMSLRVICTNCGWIGQKIYNISFHQLLDNDGNIMEVKNEKQQD